MSQVPMLLRDEGLDNGRPQHLTQSLDIGPTLLKAADIDTPETWEGTPLQSIEPDAPREIRFALDQQRVGIARDGWRFFVTDSGGERMVPEGAADKSKVHDDIEQFRRWLVEAQIGEGKRAGLETDNELDERIEQNLEDLGYL